jgi:hypothetical protein
LRWYAQWLDGSSYGELIMSWSILLTSVLMALAVCIDNPWARKLNTTMRAVTARARQLFSLGQRTPRRDRYVLFCGTACSCCLYAHSPTGTIFRLSMPRSSTILTATRR